MFCLLKIFQRNGDSETTDQHELSSPVLARYVRFHPTARNKWNCMRVEVYGTGEWSIWFASFLMCDITYSKWCAFTSKMYSPFMAVHLVYFLSPNVNSF